VKKVKVRIVRPTSIDTFIFAAEDMPAGPIVQHTFTYGISKKGKDKRKTLTFSLS
jgi:hypothetical protein